MNIKGISFPARPVPARLAVFCALCLALPALAQPTPKTRLHLLLSADSARAGETIWAGLKMEMPPSWHVYWRNGGDAGEPPKIEWSLPQGLSAGQIHWPLPEKSVEKAGDSALVTYVYTHEVVLLTPITLAADLRPGPLTLQASVHWMECSELCVMAKGDVGAALTVADQSKPSTSAALIAQWQKKIPPTAPVDAASAFWEAGRFESNSRPLVIEWKTGAAPADFYPDAFSGFSVDGTTETLKTDGGVRLRKTITRSEGGWPERITGVLIGKVNSPDATAVEVALPIQSPPATPIKSTAPVPVGQTVTMLFFAFLGGLILNIMPCVLPIIALKILSFVKQSAENPGRSRNLGLVYGIGVLVSFLILAGLAIGVQRAGGLANWGDAFRNPRLQVGLTVLMTLIALNLFGVFEITLSSTVGGAASNLASRQGYAGAFFNGVLATVLATPCTAPFLATAMAFAFTQPPGVIILVFVATGAGFALPFVLLCAQPQWLKWLPKPGAWMERFKIAMGFPMMATAVWLAWVWATSENEILRLELFLVALALAAWIWGQFVQRAARRQGFAAVCSLAVAGLGLFLFLKSAPDADAIQWRAWNTQAVEAAQRAGHPVLVDFTAKSCATCIANKLSSLDIEPTRAKLRQIGAETFIGDFTRQDPAIARELHEFNRDGVPLVLVYSKDPGKPPQVLPPILTPSMVLNALDLAAK